MCVCVYLLMLFLFVFLFALQTKKEIYTHLKKIKYIVAKSETY